MRALFVLIFVLGIVTFMLASAMMVEWLGYMKIDKAKATTYVVIYGGGVVASVWLCVWAGKRLCGVESD